MYIYWQLRANRKRLAKDTSNIETSTETRSFEKDRVPVHEWLLAFLASSLII